MKQLNENQISQLFDFVRSKYVRYIDVQYELVDHLASDIESEMQLDNELTFDKALQKVYAKFPISGFSNYVTESEKAMTKFWRKKIFAVAFSNGGIPLISSFIFLAIAQYYLIMAFNTPMIILLILIVFAIDISSTIRLRRIVKIKDQEKYLVLGMFTSMALVFSIMPSLIPNLIIDMATAEENTSPASLHYKAMGFSFLLSSGIIWGYLVYYKFPKLIREVLSSKYAHLNLSI